MTIDEKAAFAHWCEVCGLEEELTAHDGYKRGWDFPPQMGAWGVVSPRTCPRRGIEDTVWYAIAVRGVPASDLTERQRAVIARIQAELPQGLIG